MARRIKYPGHLAGVQGDYSYGDSAGITPDFPFNPDQVVWNQFAAKVGESTEVREPVESKSH